MTKCQNCKQYPVQYKISYKFIIDKDQNEKIPGQICNNLPKTSLRKCETSPIPLNHLIYQKKLCVYCYSKLNTNADYTLI